MKNPKARKTEVLTIRCTPKFKRLVLRAVIKDRIGLMDWSRRALELAALTTLKGSGRVKR